MLETIQNPSTPIETAPMQMTSAALGAKVIKRERGEPPVMLISDDEPTAQSSLPVPEGPTTELRSMASTQTDFPSANDEEHTKVMA